MYTVGNALISAHNITNLGPKAIAKRAVKDTAVGLLPPAASPTVLPTAPPRPPHTLEITEVTDQVDKQDNSKT